MKKFFILMAVLVSQAHLAFADVGDGTVLSCGTPEVFEIHSTALVGKKGPRFEATYKNAALSCSKVKSSQEHEIHYLWECVEKFAGEGRLIVEVEEGGVAIGTSAHVYREQSPPAKPQYQETLSCN